MGAETNASHVSMDAFVDPRDDLHPGASNPPARTTTELEKLAELHRLCREGRLYDVERWIRAGRPLQIAQGTAVKRSRLTSNLEVALKAGNHALIVLLLSNGYDPNQELNCPLDLALRTRRFDLVNLLLEWGADPHSVDLGALFDTYNSDLFKRFQDLGVDLTTGHALAEALAYHTSNRPLFGFAKRHRESNPKIQRELNIALGHHVDEENEKGVQLCLWAGANPHAPAPNLRYWRSTAQDDGDEEEDAESGTSAMYEACHRGNVTILRRLGPDPARDDFDELYQTAGSRAVVDLLAERAPPRDTGAVIRHQVWWAGFSSEPWSRIEALRRLFEIGARWTQSSKDEIASVRWSLLKGSDSTFIDLMKLMATQDYCSPDLLRAVARTPAFQGRMKKVGFFPLSPDDPKRFHQLRPTRSREVLQKFGVEIPQPRKTAAPPVPRSVWIGPWSSNGKEIRIDRAALFKRVWSQPVATLAEEWGLSGPGLKKVCRRLQVPVPPRGYWSKLQAGHHARRPQLPSLPEGVASEIILRRPADTDSGSTSDSPPNAKRDET
jgi:ankyrin repeat protein